MIQSKLARALLVGGVVVGVVGIAAVMLDLHTRVPPFVLKVGLLKLVLVSALAIMGAGAVVERSLGRLRAGGPPEGSRLAAPGQTTIEPTVKGDLAGDRIRDEM